MCHRFFFYPEEQLINEVDPFSSFAEDLYKMQKEVSPFEVDQSAIAACDGSQMSESPTQMESVDEEKRHDRRQSKKPNHLKRKREEDSDYKDEVELREIKKEVLNKRKKLNKKDSNESIVKESGCSPDLVIRTADNDVWQTLEFDEQGNCKVSPYIKR